MVRSMTKRGMPKPFAILIAALLVLYFVPLNAMSASADSVEGGFEIDGNLLVDDAGNIDWESVLSGPTANDNAGGDPTVFQTSSRENGIIDAFGTGTPGQWQLGSPGTAPPKADIGNIYKYIRTNEDTGDIELFFALDRMSSSGTDYFYLELNRDPNVTQGGMSVPDRSVGDVRFTLHEQGGDTIELLEISLWTGTIGCRRGSTAARSSVRSMTRARWTSRRAGTARPRRRPPTTSPRRAVPGDLLQPHRADGS